MEEWLISPTKDIVIVTDAMALIVAILGTVEAFLAGLSAAFPAPASHSQFREILVRYRRWLVAGLSFQLAADIIATSIAPGCQGGRAAWRHRRAPNLPELFPRAGPDRVWRPLLPRPASGERAGVRGQPRQKDCCIARERQKPR